MRFLTIILFFLLCLDSFGQVFKAEVSPKDSVNIYDDLYVKFILVNAKGTNFKVPAFADFRLASGPNEKHEQAKNLQTNQILTTTTWTCKLTPQATGTFIIGAASVEVNGKVLFSNKLTVKVTRPIAPIDKKVDKNQIFLDASISKKEVYVGEQILLNYMLYTKNGGTYKEHIVDKFPSTNGFWKEELQLKDAEANIKGQKYVARNFLNWAIYPQNSGTLTIGPSIVMVETAGISSVSGTASEVKTTTLQSFSLASQAYSIIAKPLPSNTPKDFCGFVGELFLQATADKTSAAVNEPIHFKILFSGKGNIKTITSPTLPTIEGFEIFQPKISENFATSQTGMNSIAYDYTLVPRLPGTYTLPPINISYFDVSKEGYVTLNSNALSIMVSGNGSYQAPNNRGNLNKEELKLLGEDVRYIKTTTSSLGKSTSHIFGHPLFIALYILPFLLFAASLFYLNYRKKLDGDGTYWTKKNAFKKAIAQLKAASVLNDKAFYEAIHGVIWQYWAEKLSLEPSQLTKPYVQAVLLEKGVPAETVRSAFTVIQQCESAVYSPYMQQLQNDDDLYASTEMVLQKMEGHLK
ncbi:MAG: BatD family protein [Chitinophagales bacterium]|nr:BatD family protein [Chitinophagales bacterium]